MKKLLIWSVVCCSLIYFSGCTEGDVDIENTSIEGLKPIYFEGTVEEIQFQAAQPIENLGKIYYKSPFIYMNEQMKGIHIFDNTNPETPEKIGFIAIPGNRDMSIKGNYLYVDNFNDLVCLDISDLSNLSEISRIEGVYEQGANSYPENYQGYFECVDESKGKVVGWISTTLNDPKCRR